MPIDNKTGSMGDGGPTQRTYVKLLLERLPSVRTVSLELLDRNEAFRDLCEEYEECTQAYERLERAQSTDAALLKEYAALRLRLESELLRYIEEHLPRGTAR